MAKRRVTNLLALLGLATGAVGVATWLAMRRPQALEAV